MARSDLLLMLVKAGARGDRSLFNRTVDAIIAEERGKQHNVLADQLEEALRKNGFGAVQPAATALHMVPFHETPPTRSLSDLILRSHVKRACQEVIEEHHRADLLRSFNLEPRHRVLLVGPPGNGKTCLAEALATSLGLPFLTVRYEAIVGSFLGETAARLLRLFDQVTGRPCVLFFDEFDTLGKERGDVHDTGEIKRVVSSLLLQIDRLPSYVLVVAATNHDELLDRAVWRRFQVRLELPPPSPPQIEEWLTLAGERWKLPLNINRSAIQALKLESFAELEAFVLDFIRRLVLAHEEKDAGKILAERVEQWKHRARKSKK